MTESTNKQLGLRIKRTIW